MKYIYISLVVGVITIFTFPKLSQMTPGVPETGSVKATLQAEVVSPDIQSSVIPTYITIPRAKVSTNVIEIGVTPEGNLDVPNNYREVGWYKYGTRPGEIGSAVFDGHVDNGGNIPGPFKYLRNLKKGDDIYVTMSDGKRLRYKVTVSKVYDLNKFPGEMVFHETGDRYLKIITCHGKFVKSLGTYNERLIITAVMVP